MSTPIDLQIPNISTETPPQVNETEALFEEAQNYWFEQSKRLSAQDNSTFRIQMGAMVNKIKRTLSCMSLAGKSSEDMQREVQNQLTTLHTFSRNFFADHAFQHDQVEVMQSLDQFNTKIKNQSVDFPPFTPMQPAERQKTARELMAEDPMWAYKLSKVEESMALARMTAGAINVATAVASVPIEILGKRIQKRAETFCQGTETGKQVCQKVAELGSYVKEEMSGVIDTIESIHASYIRTKPVALPTLLEERFLIPRERSLQYVEDSGVVTSTAALTALTGGIGKVVGKTASLLKKAPTPSIEKALQYVEDSGVVTSPAVLTAPIKKAPTPSISGFQAYVNTENKIKAQLSVLYTELRKDGRSFPSLPFTTIPKHQNVYFHATSFCNALSILHAKSIKRLDQGCVPGAFVSTHPEQTFGDIVFVFNRSIEQTAKVLNIMKDKQGAWIGFSKAIPVTSESLESVAVSSAVLAEYPLNEIANQLSAAAGRDIKVIPLEPTLRLLKKRLEREGIHIPDEFVELFSKCKL